MKKPRTRINLILKDFKNGVGKVEGNFDGDFIDLVMLVSQAMKNDYFKSIIDASIAFIVHEKLEDLEDEVKMRLNPKRD